jgi:hypothetical protein
VDEPASQRRPAASFAPDRRLTAATGAGALLALVVAISGSDAPGQLLAAIAAGLLAAYTATDLLFAPRLAVDAAGVRVNTLLLRRTLAWSEIDSIRADSRLRHGLRSVALEIDAGDVLVVMSRRALGEHPDRVAELIAAFAPPRGY